MWSVECFFFFSSADIYQIYFCSCPPWRSFRVKSGQLFFCLPSIGGPFNVGWLIICLPPYGRPFVHVSWSCWLGISCCPKGFCCSCFASCRERSHRQLSPCLLVNHIFFGPLHIQGPVMLAAQKHSIFLLLRRTFRVRWAPLFFLFCLSAVSVITAAVYRVYTGIQQECK